VRGHLRLQSAGNRFQDTVHVTKHFVVPKPKDAIAAIYQPFLAHPIPRIGRVLSTVDFNNQAPFSADKIDDIRPNWLLPNELAAGDRTRSQPVPEPQLGYGGIAPKPPRAISFP